MPYLRISGDAARAVFITIAAGIFASLVGAGGIPALRHDWSWPAGRPDFARAVLEATSGWGWSGLGYPRAYQSDDLFTIAVFALVDVLGSFPAFAVLMFAIAFALMWAVDRLAALATPDPVVRASAAAFALFNPWVYAKIVAGHYAMVLSCAGLAFLIAEAVSAKPRQIRSSLVVACLIPQLQFFLLSVPIVLYLAWRRKPLPAVTALLLALPILIGVASSGPYLATLPFTLEWQNVQSLAPRDAALLVGYFPGYLSAISWIAYPMAAVAALAATGAVLRGVDDKRSLWWTALIAAFLVAAMGTKSFIAPLMAALFINVRVSAVFRELYDLLGIVALGYAFFASVCAARWPIAKFVFAAAAIAMLAAWFAVPPANYWVDARALPQVAVPASPDYRVAFAPPFQPYSFRGAGSGADPQAASLVGTGAMAVNEYEPSYPVNVALARYARDGGDRELAALGVDEIVDRPWLQPGADRSLDASTRSRAQALRSLPEPPATSHAVAGATALMSLAGLPQIGSLNRIVGTGGAFFADAVPGRTIRRFEAPAITPDPDRGWTTVDLATPRYPQVAQGIGGTATASRSPLRAHTGAWTLAFVSGTLWDGEVARRGRGFGWMATAPGDHVFRCAGVCALVATADAKPPWPLEPASAARYGALSYRRIAPWWLEVDVPPHAAARTLRFNASYDAHWVALGLGSLPHLRIDAAVNGWILPPSTAGLHVELVHVVAAVQAALAGIALVWTLALIAVGVYRAIRTSGRSSIPQP